LAKAHDAEQTRRYVEEHRLSLETEIAERRNTAHANRESLRSTRTPATEAEWLNWLTDNNDALNQRMQTTTVERSAMSRRLRANPTVRKNATRLAAPRAPPTVSAESKPEWWKWLQGRGGWLCVRSAQSAPSPNSVPVSEGLLSDIRSLPVQVQTGTTVRCSW
jgi:hypothetical protein